MFTTNLIQYRGVNPRWIKGLLYALCFGTALLLGGYFLMPKIAWVQTNFYLTILLPALLLIGFRKDFSFVISWQFFSFISLAVVLAVSTLWADQELATRSKEGTYYVRLVLCLAIFYCALYLVLEASSVRIMDSMIKILVVIGLISSTSALIIYIVNGGLESLPRIRGLSLEGDIDKTSMLFGFHALFCSYGIHCWSRNWKRISVAALTMTVAFITLSQTKVPILMAVVAVATVLFTVFSRNLLVILGGLGFFIAGYFLLFGDLPLLHRSNAYTVRLQLWQESLQGFFQSPWLGSGLVYKQFLDLGHVLPHPHNYLVDVARFSGLLGLFACAWQLLAGLKAASHSRRRLTGPLLCLLFSWFAFGVLAMLVYAQQPLVRPNYIWFFYWIPFAALLVVSQLGEQKTCDDSVSDIAQRVENKSLPAT